MSVTVREAGGEDLMAMAALENVTQPNPWSLATFGLEFASNNRLIVVAESYLANQSQIAAILGFACGWVVADELQLHNVVVANSHKQRGIGKQLMSDIYEKARTRGATSVVLEVRMANLPAIALYRRFGLSIVGWRPGYYELPIDDACMMTGRI